MSGLEMACRFTTLIGLLMAPIGLWRILTGALSRDRHLQKVNSGQRLFAVGVFLMILGVICYP